MKTSPILVNADGRPTVHHFARLEPVEVVVAHELVDGTSRLTRSTGQALIYTCSETGAERVWGCQ